eukprot:gene10968-14728_t
MKDYNRVLKGINLVVDQIILRNKPDAIDRLSRARYHINELVSIMNESFNDSLINRNTTTPNSNQHRNDVSTNISNDPINSKIPIHKSYDETKIPQQHINIISNPNFSDTTVATISRPFSNYIPESTANITDSLNNINIANESTAVKFEESASMNMIENQKVTQQTYSVENIISSPHPTLDNYNNPEIDPHLVGFDTPNASSTIAYEQMESKKQMNERAVPATQLQRMFGFGSLAVRMAMGSAASRASNFVNGMPINTVSDDNAERLAEALCRMRGAALKLGQMLSLQDEATLPPALAKALDRVRQSADYMPKRQLEAQLSSQLGDDWKSKLLEFDPIPIAAASIGQVHKAKLLDGTVVAMKIQYPGVADSIESDLNNLRLLVDMANVLPPGLFINQIINVARTELTEECNYIAEAKSQTRYRSLIMNDKMLKKYTNVPQVFPELSTNRILTSSWVEGISIDKAILYSQEVRNAIARTVLILAVRELFEWRFIQSDPNFGNFLYDDSTKTIQLIDYGAAREYSKSFVDGYMKLVWAAANEDKDTIIKVSKDLHFLTGDESDEFVRAHVETGLVVGEPFRINEPFDFANSQLTSRISKFGGTFMKYRLTPPPTEAYSLHRKLAGAFLLCIKLKAKILCRDILEDTFNNYKFD